MGVMISRVSSPSVKRATECYCSHSDHHDEQQPVINVAVAKFGFSLMLALFGCGYSLMRALFRLATATLPVMCPQNLPPICRLLVYAKIFIKLSRNVSLNQRPCSGQKYSSIIRPYTSAWSHSFANAFTNTFTNKSVWKIVGKMVAESVRQSR